MQLLLNRTTEMFTLRLLAVLFLQLSFNAVNSMKDPVPSCSFEYERQPPSATPGGCSPYVSSLGRHIIQVTLECAVRKQPMMRDVNSFEIRWFRRTLDDDIDGLGPGDPITVQGSTTISRYHDLNFFNAIYEDEDLEDVVGDYWCQVFNTAGEEPVPLMKSNIFSLLPPMRYNQSTCNLVPNILRVDNTSCADLVTPPLTPPTQRVLTTTVTPQPAVTTRATTAVPTTSSLLETSDPPTPAARSTVPSPSKSLTPVPAEDQLAAWVYTVTGVAAVFLLIILALVITIVVLVLRRKSRHKSVRDVQPANNTISNMPLYSAVQKQYPVTYTETALSTENNYRLAGQPEYSEVTSKTLQHPAQSNPPHVYFTLQQAQAGPPSEASPYEQPVVTMPRHDYDEVKKLQMSNEEHFYHHLNHT